MPRSLKEIELLKPLCILIFSAKKATVAVESHNFLNSSVKVPINDRSGRGIKSAIPELG